MQNLLKINTEKEAKLVESFAYSTSDFITILEADFQSCPFAYSQPVQQTLLDKLADIVRTQDAQTAYRAFNLLFVCS
jgi:hypothetical protein